MINVVVSELWMVTRTDEAGNTFVMKDDISQELAEAMVELYTERGHKQHYGCHCYTVGSKRDIEKKLNIIPY
ncbi:MAG: hypothetical protein HY226_05260 [Candidatus Vogelbacteria bacterium]|nr:hypothetical protein [Candidatus Vogelbacteria bacterium]